MEGMTGVREFIRHAQGIARNPMARARGSHMWGSREQLMVEEALIDSPEALNLTQKVLGTDCGGGHDHSCASGKITFIYQR